MARDSQTKISKREQVKRSKKQEELSKKKKKVANSDSDSNDGSESESDEMDVHEYRKFLKNIFPSKHLDKKIKSGEKVKELLNKLNAYGENKLDQQNFKKRRRDVIYNLNRG